MSSVKRRKASLILIGALCMASCVTMTLTDVGNLRKGMTVEEARASLPLPAKSEFPIQVNAGGDVRVCTYILSSGDYHSNYFLAFRDNKLLIWGYPHEFARSADPLINEIGEKAVAVQAKLDAHPFQQRAQSPPNQQ
jgi:hypothetical protein